MKEKERQKMQDEYDRLDLWIRKVEEFRDAESGYGIFVPTPELDDVLRRGYKRLGKLGRRLGIIENEGIPWFQFYDTIVDSISPYLPVKYQDYKVQIKTIRINGQKTDVMQLWKEGAPELPVLQIGEYTDRVVNGADEWRMLGKMANDYKKLICPEKRYQRER